MQNLGDATTSHRRHGRLSARQWRAQSTRPGQGQGSARPARPATAAPARRRPPASSDHGDPRAATARRLCGVCHPFETVVAIRRTKSQWEATVENMIGRGARGTPAEFATVIDFLRRPTGWAAAPGPQRPPVRDDKPLVDPKASEMGTAALRRDCGLPRRGRARHAARAEPGAIARPCCTIATAARSGRFCARRIRRPVAGAGGPTVRVRGAHRTPRCCCSRISCATRVNDTLRGAPMFKPGNVLTGDREGGRGLLQRRRQLRPCHSPTGDLAGIGRRSSRSTSQQRFLFPADAARRGRPRRPVVTVTVTTESGETLSGPLGPDGRLQRLAPRRRRASTARVRRTPGTSVVKNDPFAAHVELLEHHRQEHPRLVAYLETLK